MQGLVFQSSLLISATFFATTESLASPYHSKCFPSVNAMPKIKSTACMDSPSHPMTTNKTDEPQSPIDPNTVSPAHSTPLKWGLGLAVHSASGVMVRLESATQASFDPDFLFSSGYFASYWHIRDVIDSGAHIASLGFDQTIWVQSRATGLTFLPHIGMRGNLQVSTFIIPGLLLDGLVSTEASALIKFPVVPDKLSFSTVAGGRIALSRLAGVRTGLVLSLEAMFRF